MKKLLALSLAALVPFSVNAESNRNYIDVHVMAKSYPATVQHDANVITKGDYWVQVQNNTAMPQAISIVYKHCTQGDTPVCEVGQYVQIVNQFDSWKQQFTLAQSRSFAYGEYAVGDEIDVRVDSTGQHYTARDRNSIRAG